MAATRSLRSRTGGNDTTGRPTGTGRTSADPAGLSLMGPGFGPAIRPVGPIRAQTPQSAVFQEILVLAARAANRRAVLGHKSPGGLSLFGHEPGSSLVAAVRDVDHDRVRPAQKAPFLYQQG